MILTDTGPLVAMINRNDSNHARCLAALRELPAEPMLTTWPCLTEAMYLLQSAGGVEATLWLWRMLEQGSLSLHEFTHDAWPLLREMMNKYADLPMDLGDASLVAAAHSHGQQRIFTFDRHFQIYRLPDGRMFDIVPS